MKKHFPIIIEQDRDGIFIVECPVFKGCRSYEYTIEEAIENIKEAVELCMEIESSESLTSFVGIREIEISAL